MSTRPILESVFYHDGRGPELQRVVWKLRGAVLVGFEYFNPDDKYVPDNLKHLVLEGVEAYSMASEEVHGSIMANGDSKAAIFEVVNSPWLVSLNKAHLPECKHYQIMFYDEIYDLVCKSIKSGVGNINA
ncbi:hypothetical protein SAMN05660691_04132 [Rheinheimera pacifica]|uniref:Uncharacterized protein n=1 Tax=Rheinheimera pacifica TaxID=173990 RepID=A0A1H6NF74_9GAMM|nr:hypothetical protein [Rheinheimera pacifica]SEI13831.1 hypothetical protein SAMN05660691_04132 [Rheinheimera pacifica]